MMEKNFTEELRDRLARGENYILHELADRHNLPLARSVTLAFELHDRYSNGSLEESDRSLTY